MIKTSKLEKIRILYGESENINCNVKNQEKAIKNARRSLHYSRNLSRGDIIKDVDLIAKRPGDGISPMLLSSIIGKTLKKDVIEDFKVSKDDFK